MNVKEDRVWFVEAIDEISEKYYGIKNNSLKPYDILFS